MSQGNLAIDNILLFLDIDHAIAHLNQWISRNRKQRHLLVVVSEKARQAADQIAQALQLSVAAILDVDDIVSIDINMIKEVGRDLPQDVILQEARNLKIKLISSYESIYKQVSSLYPNEMVILVDELINDGSDFILEQNILSQDIQQIIPDSNTNRTPKETRRFVYLHLIHKNGDGINMIIEQPLT